MVLAFAEAGASVIIAGRRLDAAEALAADITRRFGREALPVAADMSRWDDCEALVDAAYGRFDRVDVLVNNAGVSPLYPSVDRVTEDRYDETLAVNLKGPFRLTALVGSRMAVDGGGSIINISSVEAARPDPAALPYAAAKAGLEALTLGFANAFGPTVRVNTIRCGMIRAGFVTTYGDPGVVNEAEDVVGAALYLATDASAYRTSATIRLDAGRKR
jgi:NAD(P)-dependent dehydrogenase (short-subunit alcohol dehydrogenase family)